MAGSTVMVFCGSLCGTTLYVGGAAAYETVEDSLAYNLRLMHDLFDAHNTGDATDATGATDNDHDEAAHNDDGVDDEPIADDEPTDAELEEDELGDFGVRARDRQRRRRPEGPPLATALRYYFEDVEVRGNEAISGLGRTSSASCRAVINRDPRPKVTYCQNQSKSTVARFRKPTR